MNIMPLNCSLADVGLLSIPIASPRLLRLLKKGKVFGIRLAFHFVPTDFDPSHEYFLEWFDTSFVVVNPHVTVKKILSVKTNIQYTNATAYTS